MNLSDENFFMINVILKIFLLILLGFKDLLMEKTSPPTLFGASLMPLYFVLARMGQIESDLRPMFTEKDWPAVKKLIDAGVMATE